MSESSVLVEFRDVGKAYGGRAVLRGVDLAVETGDFMVVYGPPAAGKTVLMRLLMGLEQPTAGEVWLRGENMTRVPAADRNVGYVPQSFALYPHLSVHDNIAYPLRLAGVPGREAEPVVAQAAEMLKIVELLGKRPDQLSGGQKQRVAIARGIAKQTEIFVLDDPLAGLDFKLREQLVDDLKDLQQTWNATFLYTTSDAIEALTLADHLAVLANGTIAEVGVPEELYDAPGRAETMHLLGFPRANFLSGSLSRRGDGGFVCETDLFEFSVRAIDGAAEQPVTVGLRPERIVFDGNADGAAEALRLPATVLLREDLGGEEIVYLDVRGVSLTTVLRHDADEGAIPDEATIALDPASLVVFAADGTRLGQGTVAGHVWKIGVERLTKRFTKVVAVDDVSFAFPESEVTCLLGPSGCGKTTLMRMIAGLEKPSAGEIYFGELRVTRLKPSQRDIGMVFQYPVVYRGISVERNIELPLRSAKIPLEERRRRIETVVEILGLQNDLQKDITRLDNGTRQKVAVARAVARQPRIILFDEPITNVDADAKLQLKRAFKELTRQLRQTIVYVTHDQTEAMTLADRIALMQDGKIVQCDAPRELYNHPADVFAGWFLGNPGMNFFPATVERGGSSAVLGSPLFSAPVPLTGAASETEVTVGIRPEHIRVSAERGPGGVEATVTRKSITIGRQYLLAIERADQGFKAKVPSEVGQRLSGAVWVELPLDRIVLFGGDGRRVDLAPAGVRGEPVEGVVAR